MQDDLERAKAQYEINSEHAKRAHDLNRQSSANFQKSAIESANVAIRAMILVNGGAVVVLLAFVGALASGDSGNVVKIEDLVAPIRWFAFGVGLSATLAALAYLVNMLDSDIANSVKLTWEPPYVEDDNGARWLRSVRTVLHVLALLLAVAVLSVFFRGVFGVTDAMLGIGM